MPKVPSTDLYELIQSLSKSEKRYFNLKIKEEGDQKFAQLFKLLSEQKTYNEQTIVDCGLFKPSQVANLKAHLYKKVLRSLRDFHLNAIPSVEIREIIDEAQVLFNRGLYQQCSKRLAKAEKLATNYDNLELQLETLKLKKLVLSHTKELTNEKLVDDLVAKVSVVNSQINNINKFSNIQAKLQTIYRKTGYIKNEKNFKEINEIFRSNVPEVNEELLSDSEKIHYYYLMVGYYFFIYDFGTGYRYAQKWVHLFQSNPSIIRSKIEFYIQALNALLIAQNKLLLYDDFVKTKSDLRALNKLPASYFNENIRLRMLKYTFVHEFNRLFMTGEFDRGVELIERLSSGLEKFISQLDHHSRMIMFYKTACLYFGNGDFQKSLKWLNQILDSTSGDLREDVLGFSRILMLVCHYELGNIDLIPYHVRSTYRFLLQKQDLHQYQRLILRFLKNLTPDTSHVELISRFEQLRGKLIPLQSIPYERRAFVYFDIIAWLEAKIQGNTVMTILKEKAQNRSENLALA